MIDSHCHLYEIPEEEWVENGLEAMICVGADVETSKKSIELAEKYTEVYATVGVMEGSRDLSTLLEMTKKPRVVAIGECGLNKGDDTELFKFNINLAKETGLPLVVHCRDAFDGIFETLDYDKVQMHCFTGNEEEMRECVKRGWYISFGGILTFKKSEELRRVARLVPEDKILAETDSPYLAPEPVRGSRNTPANVKYVLSCLAEIRGTDMERIISENARRLFRI